MSDASKVVVWSGQFEPFGEVQGVTGALTQLLMFPGQYYDSETGTAQNWHRQYDARTGRYLEADPLGLGGGANLYAYVGGNPLGRVDPEGLDGLKAMMWAHNMVGKPGYSYFDPSEESRGRLQGWTGGGATLKCNKFVWDALKNGGDPAGRMADGRIPSASEWGNQNSSIQGYHVVPKGSRLKSGDVISDGHHVGIYDPRQAGPHGQKRTTSAAAPMTSPEAGVMGGVVK